MMCPVVFSEIEKDELGICGVVWLKILITGVSGGDILPDNSSFPYGEDQDILGLCKKGSDSENMLLLLSVAMGRCIVLENIFPGNRGIAEIGPGSDMEKGIKFGWKVKSTAINIKQLIPCLYKKYLQIDIN